MEITAKLARVRRLFDLGAQIGDHPWQAVGIAIAIGAWAGIESPRATGEPKLRTRIAGALTTVAGAVALRVMRELAMHHAISAVRDWYDHGATAKHAAAAAWAPHSPHAPHS